MKRALDLYAPGFGRFAPSEYAANTDTVSRVGADFNGDSIPDVALYGHDKTRELLLVLLSASDTVYRVFPLIENRLEPFPNGVSVGLGVRPAGRFDIPELLREPETPKFLKYPAIELSFGQEAGVLHYWNGTKFVEVITGD